MDVHLWTFYRRFHRLTSSRSQRFLWFRWNLASCLYERKRSVLCVDVKRQRHSSMTCHTSVLRKQRVMCSGLPERLSNCGHRNVFARLVRERKAMKRIWQHTTTRISTTRAITD
ncbi:unnamed protein product [Ectocarpus sp. 12 AP-2014]